MDDDGSSDPYLKCYNPGGEKTDTIHIEDSLNPLFYQVKQFTYEFHSIKEAPPVIINCYDRDDGLFDSTDDYMGSAVIPLDEKAPWVYTQMKTFKKQLN